MKCSCILNSRSYCSCQVGTFVPIQDLIEVSIYVRSESLLGRSHQLKEEKQNSIKRNGKD